MKNIEKNIELSGRGKRIISMLLVIIMVVTIFSGVITAKPNESMKTNFIGDISPKLSEPDMTPVAITFSDDNPYEGDTIFVEVTINNIGPGDIDYFFIEFWDSHPSYAFDNFISEMGVYDLLSGGTAYKETTFGIPYYPGDHLIYVKVDPYNSVDELDDANNYFERILPVNEEPDTTPPTTPILYDPGGIDTDGIFQVDWSSSSDSSGIDYYNLQMDDNVGFSSPTNYNLANSYRDFSGVGDGTYYFRVRAVDNAGNGGSWSNIEDIIVDSTPSDTTPPSTPTLYDPGGIDTDGAFRVDWSDSTDDDSGINYYNLQRDDNIDFSSPDNYNPTSSYRDFSGVGDGTYYFRVRAIDIAGNGGLWSNIEDITVAIASNTPPPTPTQDWPSNGETISSINPTLACVPVADPDGDNVYYYFRLYNSGGSTPIDEGIGSGTLYDTITLTDGNSYDWDVMAYDGTDYSAPSGKWTFTIDASTPIDPWIVLEEYPTYRIWGGDMVWPDDYYCWFSTDTTLNPPLNAQTQDFGYDTGPGQFYLGITAQSQTKWIYEGGAAVQFGSHPNTLQFLSFASADVGNIQDIRIRENGNFDINTPPDTTISSPSNGQVVSGQVTITGTASDSDGFVSSVFVQIGTGSWNLASGTTAWSYSWDTTVLPNGDYTIKAKSNDDDGAQDPSPSSILVTINNIVDSTPPSSSVNLIDPYWYNTSPLTINASASDDDSGVDYVDFWYSYEGSPYVYYGNDSVAPWSLSFNWPSGEGNYDFYSRAMDIDGNYENAPVIQDTSAGFDQTDPISTVDTITPFWNNGPITITANSFDSISDIASVKLWRRQSSDNITWSAFAVLVDVDYSPPWSWEFSPLMEVYYSFETAATDLANNQEATTGAAEAICAFDWTLPSVNTTNPLDGAVNVSLTADVYSIKFNEPMNPVGMPSFTNLPGVAWSWDVSGMWYNGTYGVLSDSTTYYVDLASGGFQDLTGNPLTGDMVFTFNTLVLDTTSPTIIITSPANLETDVAWDQNVIVTFSEPMNTGMITHSCSPDPGGWSVTWTGGNTIATYSHNSFALSTSYTFTITSGQDVAGNSLTAGPAPNPFTFTTEFPPPVLTTIVLTPDPVSLDVSTFIDIQAQGYDQYGNPMTCNPVWTDITTSGTFSNIVSGSPATARYTAGATLQSMTANAISATDGAIVGYADLEITYTPVLTTMVITSDPVVITDIYVGTVVVSVQGYDQYGNPMACTPVWSDDASGTTFINIVPGSPATADLSTDGSQISGNYIITAQDGAISDTAPLNILGDPQMEITKTAPAFANTGETISYWLTYTNTGTEWASDVWVNETYPAGATFVSSIPPPTVGDNCWYLGNVAPGASGSIQITMNVNAVSGVLMNNASLEYTHFMIPMPPEYAWANTTIINPEVWVEKTAPAFAHPGEMITYTIWVNNTGTDWAYNVVVTETYPPEVTYIASIPVPDIGNNVWIIPALAPGSSYAIFITVEVDIFAMPGSVLTNVVTCDYENGVGIAQPTVSDSANTIIINPLMIIDKTAPATAIPGELITYTISYVNTGTDTAHNVIITETYPVGVTFVSAIPLPDIGNNMWFLGDIAPGASGTITITVQIDPFILPGTVLINNVTCDYDNGFVPYLIWDEAATIIEIGPVQNIDTGEYFNTIQSAINDANTLNGHTILVNAGTYFENLLVNKQLTIIGENKDTTTINVNGDSVWIQADWVTITGFTITGGWGGIFLDSSDNCLIEDNTIQSNSFCGIYLWNSHFNTIQYNELFSDEIGIYLDSSNDNTIGNNYFDSNNVQGLYAFSSSGNLIHNNTIYSSGTTGIILQSSSTNNLMADNILENNPQGIRLDGSCTDNTIQSNYINSSTSMGIIIESSSHLNLIVGNTISYCNYGIYISNSFNNEIYHNNILYNTIQAEDSAGNLWDNGYPSGGNYWSDYAGIDAFMGPAQDIPGSDEIGDTPYVFAFTQDNYPLMTPVIPTEYMFSLILEQGWNLFSIPIIPDDTTLDAIFGTDLTGGINQGQSDKIFKWDSVAENWLVAYLYEVGGPVDGWIFVSDAFIIEPDAGYWIWIRDDLGHPSVTINITGELPGERNVPLSVGWNLVGYTCLTPFTLQNGDIDSSGLWDCGFTGGLNQAESDRVQAWDGSGWVTQYIWENGTSPLDGTWVGTTFDLAPGKAYWIEIREAHAGFVWTYGG